MLIWRPMFSLHGSAFIVLVEVDLHHLWREVTGSLQNIAGLPILCPNCHSLKVDLLSTKEDNAREGGRS